MNKNIFFVLISLVVFNLIAWSFVLKNDDHLKVVFFNVGQGDSIFIETSRGHQILIDGGPDNSVLNSLEKVMNPFDKNIDMVILTHADKDHLGGLISVLKTYNIDSFVWTGAQSDSEIFKELVDLIKNENVVNVDIHDRILAADIELEIYNPINSVEDIKDLNDTSIVAKLIHGNSKFLLTGDLSSNFEDDLINNFDLKSNILKIGHHGSNHSTSDEFLKAVSPNCAVIQVGKNSYGHPAERVMSLLEKNNVKILRTDINGDIVFYSDKENIFFKK
jgi:competence protein ComEC